MRYLFALLLAGLLAPGALAQPQPSHAGRILGSEARSLEARALLRRLAPAERSPSHRPDVILHHVFEDDAWVIGDQRIFTYEGLARKEEWTYVRDGEAMYNDTRTTFATTPTDPVAELIEAWDRAAGAFVPASRYVNLFDTTYTDIREGMLFQEWDGSAWVDRERTLFLFVTPPPTYIRTVNGAVTEAWDGQGWTPVERYELADGPDGLVELRQVWEGGAWVPAERIRYPGLTFGTYGSHLARLQSDLEDYPDLSLSLRYLPPQERQVWDGHDWVNTERLTWEMIFMPTGDPSVIAHEFWQDGAWVTETRQQISYEAYTGGFRPASLHMQIAGAGWQTVFTETYQYDALGDLVQVDQQMDTGDGLEDVAWYTIRWKELATGVEDDETPDAYALDAAYPNPFNPATTLSYRLAAAGPVAVRVYDALGRRVATLFDGVQAAGTHDVAFDAAGLPSGLYLVRLEAPGFRQTRAVTLVK